MTVLKAGDDLLLSVTFTPSDTTDYAGATDTTTIDVLPAASPATNLAISPDTGASSVDGVTDTGAITLSGKVSTVGTAVDVFDMSTNRDLGNATVTGTSFSLPLKFAEGSHLLRERTSLNGTDADAFFTVLVDLTLPTSTVSALPKNETNLTFAVAVTGTDGGSPPSGVKSFDIYSSTNGGPWTFWTTVSASSATSNFTGQSNTTYAFYSIAHDLAGNTEVKHPVIEASTYVPNLTPPVTTVNGTTGSNPSTINTSNGTFTLNLTGNDPGGGLLTYFDLFVSIDSGAYQEVGPYAIPAGLADTQGKYHSTMPYQGLTDGLPHSYSFYSVGLDSAGNMQAVPASPNVTFASQTFAVPGALAVSSFTVEHGSPERSYIRYLDIGFNETVSQSAGNLSTIISSLATGSPDIQIYKYDLNGTAASKTAVSLAGVSVKIIDHAIELDFGINGIGGNPNTTTADGYYEVDIKPPGGALSVHHFDRLLGDVTGDGIVDQNDLNEIAASINESAPSGWTPLSADVTGTGTVNAIDLTLATHWKGRKLAPGLPLG